MSARASLRTLARAPLFWPLLLGGIVLIAAAAGLGGTRQMTVGSPAERLYVRDGFYGPETSPQGAFRWTHDYAQLVLPHLGAGAVTLHLTLLDAAPAPRAVWITLDGQEIYRGTTRPGAPWTLTVQGTTRAETPLLGIASTPWTPPGDSRALGVGFQALAVTAPDAGLRTALAAAALLVAVLALVGAAVAVTGQTTAPLVAGIGVLGFLGPLLAYGDPWLVTAAPAGAVVSLIAAAFLIRRPAGAGAPQRAILWGTVALAGGLLLFTLMRFNTGDAEAMYQITAGLALDQAPWAHQDHAWVKFGLGKPLLDLPLYELGRLWAVATGADAAQLTRFAVALLNQIVTPLTALVLFLGARRRYGDGVALALAGTFLLATPAVAYARLAFAEPVSALLILSAALLLWPLTSDPFAAYRPARRQIIAAGLGLGLAVLVKPANAIYVPLPALYLAWVLARWAAPDEGRRTMDGDQGSGIRDQVDAIRNTQYAIRNTSSIVHRPSSRQWAAYFSPTVWGGLALFAAGLLPGLALTAGYNVLRYGSPLIFGYEQEGFTTPLLTGLYGLLLSPGKGILWFAPPVVLSAVALARLLRGAPPLLRAEAGWIAGQAAIVLGFHALWSSWEGNIAWGPRLILPVVPLLLWPLGALATVPTARRIWGALGALGFVVAIPGALIDQFYYFDLNHVTQGGTTIEQQMLFDPAWSQIVAHWRFLLTGTREAVWRPLLADFGLAPGWDVIVPAALAVATVLAVAAGLRAMRET